MCIVPPWFEIVGGIFLLVYHLSGHDFQEFDPDESVNNEVLWSCCNKKKSSIFWTKF